MLNAENGAKLQLHIYTECTIIRLIQKVGRVPGHIRSTG